jgi:quercetin dioxygenase-like cupin family protein
MSRSARGLAIAAAAMLCATATGVALQPMPPAGDLLRQSAVFLWESASPTPTTVGEVRRVFRAPTATLDELEYHVTTLEPGQSPHPPHQHLNEEVIIVKAGSLDAYVNGEWMPVSTGSLIFFASNQPHTVRNPGKEPATYHVINWASPGMLEKGKAAAVTDRCSALTQSRDRIFRSIVHGVITVPLRPMSSHSRPLAISRSLASSLPAGQSLPHLARRSF